MLTQEQLERYGAPLEKVAPELYLIGGGVGLEKAGVALFEYLSSRGLL